MGTLRILLLIAFRNLFTHKITSTIVGSVIFFGTFLVVSGSALLDSINQGMARSVTSSLAGHLQLYSADARDELALFGSAMMGANDHGEIDDFARTRAVVEAVPNVKAVVPMGLHTVTVATGNEIDQVLEALHEAVGGGNTTHVKRLGAQIRDIVADLRQEQVNALSITADEAAGRAAIDTLDRVLDPTFWNGFDADPQNALMFLDTRIAPLAQDGRLIYLRNVGTDLTRFTEMFDAFKVVRGEAVPDGQRGFLFSRRVHERWIKHRVAHELDELKRARDEKGLRIADDPILSDRAERLPRQYRRITYQLDPEESADLEARLRPLFPEVQGPLVDLIQAFLAVDDANLDARYGFFYEHIAPTVRLYYVDVGDTLTLRAFTKNGYITSANVKVYGTFDFAGLEKSDLAGAQNLLDMVTFRDLYGVMTRAQKRELQAIQADVGLREVQRGSAEAALFGEGEVEVDETETPAAFDEFAEVDLAQVRADQRRARPTFDQQEIDAGLAINAAVLLEDPRRVGPTRDAIEEALAQAGLALKVVNWKEASGLLGQFITVVMLVLVVAVCIIFSVALVIINNSMVMATMERVSEIGTMRAIGAQRGFVLAMFILETLVLGAVAGALGTLAGVALIQTLGHFGLPATTDVMMFIFSGTRLYPNVGMMHVALGFVAVLVVSILSTVYPARLAARTEPVVAMNAKE